MKINETVGELLTRREVEMGIGEPRCGVVSYLVCKSCSPGSAGATRVQMKGRTGKFPQREKTREIMRMLLGKNE